MAGGKLWTKDEFNILMAKYQSYTQEEILGLLPGRNWDNVRHKAWKLGLRRPETKFKKGQISHNAWPASEVKLLKKTYPKLPPSELYSLFPNRTIKAIIIKAGRLGLKRPSERFAETRGKNSRWQRGRQLSPEHKANVTKAVRRNPPWLGKHLSQEVKDLLSELAKQRLLDPEYRRKVMSNRRPTDIEQKTIDIIKKYNLPYKYTGNGTFQIGRFNPDFVNTNNEKIALDIFGDYWHSPDEIPERKAVFAEYGWKLVIIWGHELKKLSERQIATKLRGARRLP